MRTRTRALHLKVASALGLALLWSALPGPAPAGSTTIPAGFDLFETDPGATVFDVQLPQSFFGPGSDPFTGRIKFAGEALETFMGKYVGDTDTVVQRAAPADPMPNATVPIEIVALSLVSVEPMTITYNGGQAPELWDVKAGLSPSRRSQGQMTIIRTTDLGGTFNSQLQVVPLLTFVRLSDGQTRAFDGTALPPQQLTLLANAVPWRAGCVLPALAVPGLNDGFCPSFTPEGEKRLTIEDSLLADHGVRPAQPVPQHFKCYGLRRAPFRNRQVTLTDQFGTRQAKATGRRELCNPARKGDEVLRNRRAHLVCYAVAGQDLQKLVVVRNQLGSQRLLVHEARRLCVPSQKRRPDSRFKRIQLPIDHLQCYRAEAQTPLHRLGPLGRVRITDQFGRERVLLGGPIRLCAPAQKGVKQIQHPVHHWVCYAIQDRRVREQVVVRNQFEKREVTTRRPVSFCVPSAKVVVTGP